MENVILTKLPRKPVIRKTVQIIPVKDDALMFKDGKKIQTMRGRTVASIMEKVIPLLDGSRTLEEIIPLLTEVNRNEMLKILGVLHIRGILEDASIEAPLAITQEELRRYDSQIHFFSRFHPEKYRLQEKLKNSKITIFGLGPLGIRTLSILASAGIGEISMIDGEAVKEDDIAEGTLYDREDLGQGRAETAKKRFSRLSSLVNFMALGKGVRSPEDIRYLVKGRDLAILCLDTPSPAFSHWMNEACLEEGVSWTSAWLEEEEGMIGPSIVPHLTPCYRCYDLRMKGNLAHYDEYLAYERYVWEKGTKQEEIASLCSFAGIVAGHLALEVIKILSKFVAPATYGHIYTINFLTLEAKLHEILKLPRCPSCSPKRKFPPRKAWDI